MFGDREGLGGERAVRDEPEGRKVGLVRLLLRSLLGTLALAAVLGLWGILVGDLDGFPLRVFLLSLATAGYSILGLGCAVPLERQLWKQWATIGIAVTVLAYGLTAVVIFLEVEELLWWMGALTTWSVAFSHTSLLTLARLLPRYQHIRMATTGLAIILAMLLTFLFLTEFDVGDEEIWVRALGALSLLVAVGTLAVPILHRMSGIAPEATRALEAIEQVDLHCPRCQRRQAVFLGGDVCERCGLRISVELSEDDALGSPRGDRPAGSREDPA